MIVMAEDDEIYTLVSNASLPNVHVVRTSYHLEENSSVVKPNAVGLSHGTHSYKKLVTTRPLRLLSVLCSQRLGVHNLIYADVDSVWVKNPIPVVEAVLNSGVQMDLVAQMDNTNVTRHTSCYCTGFLGMKNNYKVLQLMSMWEQAVAEDWKAGKIKESGDQPVFNKVISSLAAMKLGLRHGSLPVLLFPPGYKYFDTKASKEEQNQAVVVHNNWIVGHRAKKMRFYIWDLWKAKEKSNWWGGEEANIKTNQELVTMMLNWQK